MRIGRTHNVALSILALLLAGYAIWASWQIFGKRDAEIGGAPADFPTVIRTNGGLLEAATLRYRRTFNLTNAFTVLGYQVPFCRETASYTFDTYTTYRTRLAKRWLADYHDGRLAVVAPPLEPALPVAFDTTGMVPALARCHFVPGLDAQKDLLRSISRRLAQDARSPEYLAFVKDHGVHGGARDTVREFVAKWLAGQDRRIPKNTPIDVTFAGDAPPR